METVLSGTPRSLAIVDLDFCPCLSSIVDLYFCFYRFDRQYTLNALVVVFALN